MWKIIYSIKGIEKTHSFNVKKITNVILVINSIHNGQKDNKCDTCGKGSFISGYVKIHTNSVH